MLISISFLVRFILTVLSLFTFSFEDFSYADNFLLFWFIFDIDVVNLFDIFALFLVCFFLGVVICRIYSIVFG